MHGSTLHDCDDQLGLIILSESTHGKLSQLFRILILLDTVPILVHVEFASYIDFQHSFEILKNIPKMILKSQKTKPLCLAKSMVKIRLKLILLGLCTYTQYK